MITLLTPDKASSLVQEATKCTELQGEFWECGVYKGGSAELLAKVIEQTGERPLRLFDSFSGLPTPSKFDMHCEGEFVAEEEDLKWLIEQYEFIRLHKGLVPESLVDAQIAFVHLDMDLYEPTKGALEFILPRLVLGGKIVLDDWDWWKCPGIRKAVEELGLEAKKLVEFQASITKGGKFDRSQE